MFVVQFFYCLRVWQELHFILTHTSSYKRLLWHDSVVCGHLTQMLFSWWLGRWRFQSCSIPSVKYCKIIFCSLLSCSYYFCNSFEENNVWGELCFCEICIYLYIPLLWTFWYMYFILSKVFYLVSESSAISLSAQSHRKRWTLTLSEQTWEVCRK